MAVDIKFSVCQSSNCKSINFTEKTGLYDATDNPTGWDPSQATNESTTDATAATLTITGPDGTVYPTVDLFAVGFPKSSTVEKYSIPQEDLGLTQIVDGLYEMTYSVTTSTTTYSETQSFFFHCKIDACICKKLAALDVNACDCDEDKVNEALKAKAFSDALMYAAGCGNIAAANEILKSLQRLCGC
jgi:hypothetical protein